ncbi:MULTISPECIES: MATE family efflux transporter [Chryseobacterium]|jgi:MATE family multidrug resistance protein|uniref:Multidrug-efflux transporter n=1 Tax=Chryseobacterium balustinum TaxID=246 RepID=A0AAX2IQM0_9FLAO|nr:MULTISPECIES: MATE family efflux transporter [Chryseobacterium]AZB29035.1 MATE family efflux transporter [Chryseobacterium balustinum]OBW42544.1 Multidrug resistance protein NorM [Chryseobacterium sp. MOF25P]OBW47806.1 Multidrug resistance protein NorM [Chryseobacterium sp. BGARF1]SKB60156.1 multidrug resistance protein, MATE family [Chryseobacterium balustinum]SQA91378.1 Na(+)/drug antiporter [Chryseobacterium balustinum]
MSFLNKNYTKEALTLALPVMLTQVGQVSVNLFDNIIVGKLLGADALASVSLGNAVFFSMFVLALGFSFAIPPLVSEAHSKNDHKTINSVFSHGFVINMTVGIILMLILFLGLPLLYHSGQPAKIIPDTVDFLWIMAISIVPFMAFQTLREVSEGLSYTIGVTKATIIANVINIVLNYVLIQGIWIFPEMGVKGSALASLIARIFMVVFLYFVLMKEPKTKQYIKDFSLKMQVFSKKMFEKMVRLGFPTALQMFFEVTAFAGAAFICGLISSHDIASHQIALSMASFTFNLCIGFSVASTVMIGRKLGEQNFVELRKIGINNLKIAFLFMCFCGVIFILGRNILPTFFTKPEEVEVIMLASKLMIIAALFQLSDGIQVTALGMLRGLQDVKIPSIITFIAYWLITIPLGYFLCVTLEMGAFGMWIALGLGLTISAFMLVKRFLDMSARRIKANKI